MVKADSKRKKYRVNEISRGWNVTLTILMTLLAVACVVPVILVVCISFSSAESITKYGYQFIPHEWSLAAYKSLLETGSALWRSYAMTIFYTFGGTALSLFVMSMFAFVLSRSDFKLRNALAFYCFFTTLFSGGLVPSYIINTRYLHIDDSIWIFLLPNMVNAFNVIVLRTFMKTGIPESLLDAAKIDGANDWLVYCKIAMPLSKAGLATIGLFSIVARWNDWFTGLMYVENARLVPVMTFLQRIQKNIDYLKNNSDAAMSPEGMEALANIPSESTRMAITVIAILPLLVAYPFFQKYFVKGLTIGSVKG